MRNLILAAMLLSSPALAQEPIVGQASVIDGDTLEIHGQRIRLHGVDAPESRQPCSDASGAPYRCGQKAAMALSDFLSRSTVSCQPLDLDRYGRTVAKCFVRGVDIEKWLVSNGLAVAYRKYSGDYIAAEDEAHAAHRGIWAGQFEMPSDFRKAKVR